MSRISDSFQYAGVGMLSFLMLFVQLVPAFVYADDVAAPHIVYTPASAAVTAGVGYKIEATVKDDQQIDVVTLFYRTLGEVMYKEVQMTRRPDSDVYIASLPDVDIREPGLEYYLMAKDQAGNSVMRGFSFEPLKLTVNPAVKPSVVADVVTETPSMETRIPAAPETKSATSKWLWIGLSVLAVGAAVAAGGSDSSDSRDGGGSSGSVDISAPIPQ